MPELERSRDCIILRKGDTISVVLDDALVSSGWVGGQGVSWSPAVADKDTPTVMLTDGNPSGFLLWGSDESSDQFTAMTRNQPYYQFSTMGFGGWFFYTTSFEQFTYASRQSGPLVPLVYEPNDRLRFSLRGLWTKEDEWTASLDPRAPNPWVVGSVAHVPSSLTNNYMGVQTFL